MMKTALGVFSIMAILAVGQLPSTKLDRQGLDLALRRVDTLAATESDDNRATDLRKVGYILDAMLARRGGALPEERQTPYGPAEEALTLRLYGMAVPAEARQAFWGEVWDRTGGYLWQRLKAALWHSLPWGIILTVAWFKLRGKQRAIIQYSMATDRLPPEQRGQFTGPDLQREHARLKRLGLSPSNGT